MKKILALLLAVAVLASMLSISALGLGAEDFSDVKESSWYYEDVDFMAKHEYMNGFPDGTFRPQDLLTREQVAVIFARIWGADVSNNDVAPFDDVVPGRYSSGAIQWLKDTGLTTGTGNNKFSPQGTLTRQEFATFSARFTKLYLEGGMSAGAMISGLLVGAGVGLLVLFRNSRRTRENIQLTLILYVCGVLGGLLTGALGIRF